MPYPKNQVAMICKGCQKTYQIKASLAKNRNFCNLKCRTAYYTTIVKCQNCDNEITTYKNNPQKYCSISCAVSARNKTDANPSKHRDLSGKNNPMYGKGFLGEDNPMYGKTGEQAPMWKGGRKIRDDGYVLVYAPDHPHAHSAGRRGRNLYMLEHRLIMEQYLGRYLLPEEVVHHKDGNPSNNDISNLELFSTQSEHILKAHKELWWYTPNYSFPDFPDEG